MGNWWWVLLLVGVLFGAAAFVQGAFKQTLWFTGLTGLGTLVVNLVTGKAKIDSLRSAVATALELNLLEPFYWFLTGAVVSTLTAFAGGYAVVLLTTLRSEGKAKNPEATAVAGRRAGYLFTHGLRDYLARKEEASSGAAASAFEIKLRNYHQWLFECLRRTVKAGPISEQVFKDCVLQMGSTLITMLFESSGVLNEYRLAIYRLSPDEKHLEAYISLNLGDESGHKKDRPLPRKGSFLGQALDEGRPLVYPRDKQGVKKKKRPFQDRKGLYGSFLVVPLPAEAAATRWGGVAIDYKGDDSVFTDERVRVVKDFARMVELLYDLLSRQGGSK